MGWIQKFYDEFDNASVDLLTDVGNGSITEAGTELTTSISASTDCRWWSDGHTAPVAYQELSNYLDEMRGLIRLETRLSGLARTGQYIYPELVLWKDRYNKYSVGWYDGYNNIMVHRAVANVFTQPYGSGAVGDPNTTPHRYRIYWNLTGKTVQIEDLGIGLADGHVGFAYSVNDGSSWNWAYSEMAAIAPSKFGVSVRNWNPWNGADADWDYIELSQDLNPQEELPEDGDSVQFDDLQGLYDAGGPKEYRDGQEKGQTEYNEVRFDDRTDVFQHGGVPDYADQHQWGLHLGGESIQFDESVLWGVVDAEYGIEKDDADGHHLLEGVDVRSILVADITADSFGTTSGHYGVAKDGKSYYNGVECAPGDFGTVAGGPRRTAWPYWSGGAEPFSRTVPSGCSLTMPSDDVLQMQGVDMDSEGVRVTSQFGWRFRGDFDIEVEYLDLSFSGGSDGGLSLMLFADNYNLTYVRRRVAGSNVYDKNVKINNVNTGYASVATTDTAGKMRIVRSGTVVSHYYWDGVSAWVQIGSSVDMAAVGAVPFHVIVSLDGYGDLDCDVKVTNFTINSGTTDNTGRWTWESSGDHRGTQATMPDKLLVTTTQSSLELIDADNDKLWMRFLQGTNNVMGASASGVRVRNAVWDNGVLFVAYGDEDGSGGAAIWIDFTLDQIRWHREDGDSTTGGLYGYPSLWTRGVISERNNALGYSNDYTDWQIPNYKVDDVDLYRDGIYECRAIATYAGMAMFRVTRWRMGSAASSEYSLSNETGTMRWCRLDPSDGELFYMDDTNMYSRSKAGGSGWEDAMPGGTWTAEYTKALPGRRMQDHQKHAVRYSTYLFVPADQGIYRVDWPSGSWTLFYGQAGSGATHEILPPLRTVHSIALGNDGTNDLLLISLELWQRGLVVAVKLSDNTVYGTSQKGDLKVPKVVAA